MVVETKVQLECGWCAIQGCHEALIELVEDYERTAVSQQCATIVTQACVRSHSFIRYMRSVELRVYPL